MGGQNRRPPFTLGLTLHRLDVYCYAPKEVLAALTGAGGRAATELSATLARVYGIEQPSFTDGLGTGTGPHRRQRASKWRCERTLALTI